MDAVPYNGKSIMLSEPVLTGVLLLSIFDLYEKVGET
jgi:hypothetical protein